MPKIKGEHNETYQVTEAGKRYVFTETYSCVGDGFVPILVYAQNTKITLQGIAEARNGYYGIVIQAVKTTLEIGEMAMVLGQGVGVYSFSDSSVVTNRGYISTSAGNADVWLNGANSEFVNFGTLTQGVDIRGTGSVVVNKAGGQIAGSLPSAVAFVLDAGETAKLVNHGIILRTSGSSEAFYGAAGQDIVINKGRMDGRITMGAGDDRLDTRGGVIRGEIRGGAGDDTLITDKAGYKLTEAANEGFDTVKSTVTYTLAANVEKLVLLGAKNIDGKGTAGNDTLIGNAGNNVLWSYEGNDRLDGKAGNDVLRGGAGADTFVFKTGYDRDTIVLFDDGIDKVDVSGWKAIKNFSDLINNHASNHGDDVWIVAGKDRLIIEDTQKADLDAGDFIF